MHRNDIINKINKYSKLTHCFNEEIHFLNTTLDFIKNEPACFERSTSGHVTASAWIVNKTNDKVLLTLHKKLNKWIQLGGHSDGDNDCLAVALKEAQEESGLDDFTFIIADIFDLDVHLIPSLCKAHYDVRFLLKAEDDLSIKISDESIDLAWIKFEDLNKYTESRSIHRMKEKFQKYFL